MEKKTQFIVDFCSATGQWYCVCLGKRATTELHSQSRKQLYCVLSLRYQDLPVTSISLPLTNIEIVTRREVINICGMISRQNTAVPCYVCSGKMSDSTVICGNLDIRTKAQ